MLQWKYLTQKKPVKTEQKNEEVSWAIENKQINDDYKSDHINNYIAYESLNTQIKMKRLSDWINRQNPTMLSTEDTPI